MSRLTALILVLVTIICCSLIMEVSDQLSTWRGTIITATNVVDARDAQKRCKDKKGITNTKTIYNAPRGQPRKPVAWEISCQVY